MPVTPSPLLLSERFTDALTYAARIHRNQMRKGTAIPYLSHLMSVAAIVLEHGGNEDEAIAALLHDAPEDQGGQKTLNDIRERFGDRVADIVESCSDSLEQKPENKQPFHERKSAYQRHLRDATDSSVLLVSAADKLHNARATAADLRRYGPDVWTRFNASREDSLWNYGQLVEAYNVSDPRVAAVVRELRRAVDELRLGGRDGPALGAE